MSDEQVAPPAEAAPGENNPVIQMIDTWIAESCGQQAGDRFCEDFGCSNLLELRAVAAEATAADERRVAEVERERDAVGKAASEAMSACEQHAYDFVAQREAPERRLAAIREIAEGVGGLSSPTQILAEVRRIAEIAAGDGGA